MTTTRRTSRWILAMAATFIDASVCALSAHAQAPRDRSSAPPEDEAALSSEEAMDAVSQQIKDLQAKLQQAEDANLTLERELLAARARADHAAPSEPDAPSDALAQQFKDLHLRLNQLEDENALLHRNMMMNQTEASRDQTHMPQRTAEVDGMERQIEDLHRQIQLRDAILADAKAQVREATGEEFKPSAADPERELSSEEPVDDREDAAEERGGEAGMAPAAGPPTSAEEAKARAAAMAAGARVEAKDRAAAAAEEGRKEMRSRANAALAEERSEAATRTVDAINRTKFLDVAFGVLPNSEAKINNYAHLGVNYSNGLKSKFTYHSRNLTAKAESNSARTTSNGTEIAMSQRAAADTARTTFNLSVVEVRKRPWKRVSLVIGAGADQVRETTQRTIIGEQSFEDPVSARERVVTSSEVIDERSITTMPKIELGIERRQATGLSFGAGAALLVGISESYKWDAQGVFYMPPLSKDADDITQTRGGLNRIDDHRSTRNSSNGIKLSSDVAWHGSRHGFALGYDLLSTKGTRSTFSTSSYPATPISDAEGNILNEGAQVEEVVDARVDERRMRHNLRLSWTMLFLRHWGVVPTLQLGGEVDQVRQSGDAEASGVVRQADLGVIFSY